MLSAMQIDFQLMLVLYKAIAVKILSFNEQRNLEVVSLSYPYTNSQLFLTR